MAPTPEEEIDRFLRTGDHDLLCEAWPGGFSERARRAHEDLQSALVAKTLRLAAGKSPPAKVPNLDLRCFTRGKVEPMVRGLFPAREREFVLGVLERSVIFLTPDNFETVLRESNWLKTAWDLANLYLNSLGAELLGDGTPSIVGLSEETTCYVSLEYFRESDPFADFVVHEIAHIFHNCKRGTVGLPQTRTREWLLDIHFGKRETFAYASEAYSRIRELGRTPKERRRLLGELEKDFLPPDDRVDPAEYFDILREAVSARNGWKRILSRCRPERRKRSAASFTLENSTGPKEGLDSPAE